MAHDAFLEPTASVRDHHPTESSKRLFAESAIKRFALLVFVAVAVSSVFGSAQTPGQSALPFEVSNPKNKKWEPAEAKRIYNSACHLLARTIRPDKPPELHPQFKLVLGSENDEFVRDGANVEVHLKNWQPEIFAQAVVAIAVRELLQGDQLQRVAHQSVLLANSTIDAHESR